MQHRICFCLVLLCVALGWRGFIVADQPPAPRGELRIVDTHHFNWASIVYNIFEHLIEPDKDGKLVPRLATDWHWIDDRTLEMNLRQGVRFHNGEVFDAEVVKLNWDENIRLKQPLAAGVIMNFKSGSRLQIVDQDTVRFIFPEPDGAGLIRLSLLHMANRQFHREQGWGEKEW